MQLPDHLLFIHLRAFPTPQLSGQNLPLNRQRMNQTTAALLLPAQQLQQAAAAAASSSSSSGASVGSG
jgi:hypothetical protein